MFQSSNEGPVTAEAFIPPSILGREHGRDEDLVDRRIELKIGKAMCKSTGILCEVLREIRILKITHPIRQTKMKEINNRNNVEFFQTMKRIVREFPVVLSRGCMCFVIGRAITQEGDANILHQFEIL